MEYIFKYKKTGSLFWKKRKVIGHSFCKDNRKMVLYYRDGLEEIGEWDKYDLILESDFMLSEKRRMEQSAGQSIPTEIDL